MEIYQLEYMLAVAKHQSFTRAAKEICVTQSSLSQQIKRLEAEIGINLFERTTRSVVMTPAGQEFLTYAKRIIDDIHLVSVKMREYVTDDSGFLNIGALPAIGSFGITSLIASFQRDYPKIKITLYERECTNLIEMIENGVIDITFISAFEKLRQAKIPLSHYPLINNEMVIITSSLHPFAAKRHIHLSEAAQEKFIFTESTSGLYIDTMDACQLAGFEPKVVYQSSRIDTIFGLVAEGMGIAMFSYKVALSTSRTDIAIIRFSPTTLRTVYLVYPNKPHLSPSCINFKDFSLRWSLARI